MAPSPANRRPAHRSARRAGGGCRSSIMRALRGCSIDLGAGGLDDLRPLRPVGLHRGAKLLDRLAAYGRADADELVAQDGVLLGLAHGAIDSLGDLGVEPLG